MLQLNCYFKQVRFDATLFGYTFKELNNGAFKAVITDTTYHSKKAIIQSTNGMFPAPVVCDEKDIPIKSLSLIKNKLNS